MDSKNKTTYLRLCEEQGAIPIFSQPWWLDVVCGEDQWDVALAMKKGRVIGSLPYSMSKKLIFSVSTMPPLTQTLGPYIVYPSGQRYQKKLGFEKDVCESLVDQLPRLHQFSQNFSPRITNWLPFYWRGFEQSTRYTYVLNGIKNHDALWKNLSGNIRSDVRKAEKSVNVIETEDSDHLYALVTKTFQRQGKSSPTYSGDFLKRLVGACLARNCCKMYLAVDEEGRHHAGSLIIWDQASAYYLVGGGDPELRNSGATSQVVWHSIKEASQVVDCFDFEGSMLEPVERFFRAFGGTQVPILRVSKTFSPMLNVLEFGKRMIRG